MIMKFFKNIIENNCDKLLTRDTIFVMKTIQFIVFSYFFIYSEFALNGPIIWV
jgi:hypothetical protein